MANLIVMVMDLSVYLDLIIVMVHLNLAMLDGVLTVLMVQMKL